MSITIGELVKHKSDDFPSIYVILSEKGDYGNKSIFKVYDLKSGKQYVFCGGNLTKIDECAEEE